MAYPKLTPIIATGATEPRYLDDRFSDVVNVMDFGAKGDGSTDDTESIQAAINYAKTRKIIHPNSDTVEVGAPKIFFPHGRYMVSDTISFEWMQSLWVEFDNSVIVASEEMDVVLLFKNNWNYGNTIIGCQVDMNYKASVGVQIHQSNRGHHVQNLCIHNNGDGIGLLIGDDTTSAVSDGSKHTLFDVKIIGKSGDACTYSGVGIRANAQDFYLHDATIYCQRTGLRNYGGGNVFGNIHVWQDKESTETNWSSIVGIHDSGSNNKYNFIYSDWLPLGAMFTGSFIKIEHFFLIPTASPSSLQKIIAIQCPYSTLLTVGSMTFTQRELNSINPLKISDLSEIWQIQYALKNPYQKILSLGFLNLGGSKIYPYSLALNIANIKFSKSPEGRFASSSVSSGYYLIGYVFGVAGQITIHFGMNNTGSADINLWIKGSSGQDANANVIGLNTQINPVKVSLALGTAITVEDFGCPLIPVYIRIHASLEYVSPYIEVDSAASQGFILTPQSKMSDLLDSSPTIVYEKVVWGS